MARRIARRGRGIKGTKAEPPSTEIKNPCRDIRRNVAVSTGILVFNEVAGGNMSVLTQPQWLKQENVQLHIFAAALKVSLSTVKQWSAGSRRPSRDHMKRIATFTAKFPSGALTPESYDFLHERYQRKRREQRRARYALDDELDRPLDEYRQAIERRQRASIERYWTQAAVIERASLSRRVHDVPLFDEPDEPNFSLPPRREQC